jgi:hypothetical protein
MSWGLIALGLALAVTSLLGPLALGVIRYRVSGVMTSQLKGADAVSLVLVAPLCGVIGLLARRGHPAAPALALAPATYSLYIVAETIVGPDYLRAPGNNERYFLLFLGIFLLAGAVAVTAWNLLDPSRLPSVSGRRSRAVGALLVSLGVLLVVGRYLPGLADAMRVAPANADYLAGPTIFWIVTLEDLGIVIPAMLAVGVGLWRHAHWADRLSFAVLGWAALVPVTVAVMSASMYLDDQPSASLAAVGLLSALAVVFAIPAAVCYPPLLRVRHADPDQPDPDQPGRQVSLLRFGARN